MKKKMIATLLLITMLIGSLSGCGSASKDVTETTAQTEVAEDETKAAEQEEAAAKAAEEAAAKEAEANEYFEKGRTFLYGLDGNEINLESAYTNFEKAREMGKQDASFYLGLLCYDYNYPNHDYAKAKSYFEEAEDNLYAQISLGEIYYSGDGVEVDKEKAKELFQSAIDRGCIEGHMAMGYVAYDEKDYTTAFEYFNKATEGTEQEFIANAMYFIGLFYENGYEVEQDYTKAMEWYEKSADLGYTGSMRNIAEMYYDGNGVEQDYTKALEWYEKAADLGHAGAINDMATLYYFGTGVEQDYSKALEWFERAADLGDASAMFNIGALYTLGHGVEQDYDKALEWYEKAADLGSANAMAAIGNLYDFGEGVEQDYDKALEWYDKAADLGDETAKQNAENIRNRMQ